MPDLQGKGRTDNLGDFLRSEGERVVRDGLREVEGLDQERNFERYFRVEQHGFERGRGQKQRHYGLAERDVLQACGLREARREARGEAGRLNRPAARRRPAGAEASRNRPDGR